VSVCRPEYVCVCMFLVSAWECLCVTQGVGTETAVCSGLWFGLLAVQDVLDQLLHTQVHGGAHMGAQRPLHAVDWTQG
jgi:hypothetical protein